MDFHDWFSWRLYEKKKKKKRKDIPGINLFPLFWNNSNLIIKKATQNCYAEKILKCKSNNQDIKIKL